MLDLLNAARSSEHLSAAFCHAKQVALIGFMGQEPSCQMRWTLNVACCMFDVSCRLYMKERKEKTTPSGGQYRELEMIPSLAQASRFE